MHKTNLMELTHPKKKIHSHLNKNPILFREKCDIKMYPKMTSSKV